MGTSGNRDCQWLPKRSYRNSIRVGYDRMEQIRAGVLGDGLEGLPPEGLTPHQDHRTLLLKVHYGHILA